MHPGTSFCYSRQQPCLSKFLFGNGAGRLWRHIESMVPFDGKSSSQMEAMKVRRHVMQKDEVLHQNGTVGEHA